ncbi:MAG: LLM class F420-dependent oxidoreductase [Myxococcales bacterium]|nr:LLM class F420-dependent oxidoreductase [Myxococcales bacterium]
MKLGLVLGYSGRHLSLPMELIKEADALGFDSCWTAEAYGSDAVTTAAWVLARTERIRVGTAIMQLAARAPTMAAMTALSLQHLSGNRFIVGLGPSGPQVVEGWYGASYHKPLTRLREYIEIMRQVLARQAPVEFEGEHYQLPYKGAHSSGMGKPLKSILHPEGAIPFYTATLRPKALAMSAELCDGFFPIWMNPQRYDIFAPAIEEGLARAGGGKGLADFDVAPFVTVVVGDDLDACRMPVKGMMALYIGGMGARGKNFYNTYATQLGYGDEARKIQDLYLDGKKAEAAALVPDRLVDEVALVGPADRIRGEIDRWRDAGKNHHVGSMLLGTGQPEALRLMAELVL